MGEWDSPELHCRHLLVCRHVWYDPDRPDDGYSLGKLLVSARASPDAPLPVRIPRLFLFAQLFGTAAEYRVRVIQNRLEPTGVGDEEEATFAREFGPWGILLPGEEFVESFAFPLLNVAFPEAGVYEFQLRADGVQPDELVAAERVLIKELT